MWLFVIGSPDRIAKLDQVKADIQRLADPRGLSAADGDRLARELPVVVWLVHGVHGNEISLGGCGAGSRRITCWRRRATPASTRCCATRWC